jgi:sortase A
VSDLASTTGAPAELLDERRPASEGKGSRPRRAIRALAAVLILAGVLALADAVVTLVWQEPFSWLYARLQQDHLAGALKQVERTPPTAAERRTLANIADEQARITFLAGELEQHAATGSAVGRIEIPRIGIDFVVVKGTDTESLERGPGIYPQTVFPGGGGTTAVAGHRTTFLAPFRHIDALANGSVIRMQMPYAELTYSVTGQRVVEPANFGAAVADVGYGRLVLSACTPLFSAAKRLLVYARLVREQPRGPAMVLPGGQIPHPIQVPAPSARPRRLPPVLESLDAHDVAPV